MNPRKNVALCTGMGSPFYEMDGPTEYQNLRAFVDFPKKWFDPGFSILYGTWVVPFHWASIKGDYI